jgi:CheY-like chemotaxis protein
VLGSGPPVDVILLDLMMPIMSGWEFRRVQRKDPALAGIPVVVTSASSPGTTEPDRCLAKPFGIDELLQVVAEVLRARPALAA